MKIRIALLATSFILALHSHAQEPADGSKPATTNILGQAYPRIHPDLRATVRSKAPDAQKMEMDLMKKYPMTKNVDGVWSATTDPLVPGFHCYSIFIDGVAVCDPASETFLIGLGNLDYFAYLGGFSGGGGGFGGNQGRKSRP